MIDKPQNWLHKLFNTQAVVYWPWRHSLRLTLITTVPLTVGFLYDNLIAALFVCLGGLLSAISVQTDPYRERFSRIFTAVPFGMSGYLIGSLIAEQGLLTIVGVVFVALISGWISFWGKAFSAGALQMLVMTVVASHVHPSSMSMMMPLLFGLGAVYAALLLSIEALFIPKQPERKLTSLIFVSLAKLAHIAAERPVGSPEVVAAMHGAIEAQANAYSVVLQAVSRNATGDEDAGAGRKILALADRLTVLLVAQQQGGVNLREVATSLELLSQAMMKSEISPVSQVQIQGHSELATIIGQLWALVQTPLTFPNQAQKTSWKGFTKEIAGLKGGGLYAQFEAQRSNLVNILSLAFCMLIAMLAEFHLPGNRSYWIPLSVAVILKPDFGSVFVRAVQRSAGTLIGVLIAVLIFYLVPKGLWLVVVVGCLSAIIPWASLKNYAWQCTFLTPLILILIDLIIAGPTIDYGPQRLMDTLLGALIVLVFGYFIWPKPVKSSFVARYAKLHKAIITYIDALRGGQAGSSVFDKTVELRHGTYLEMFGLRKWLQNFLAEPPPASHEALLWLPRIDEAEKLVDRLDDYVVRCEAAHKAPEAAQLDAFRDEADKLTPVGVKKNKKGLRHR